MPAPQAMLITGASTGIGAACALHFARAGWLVYAGVRRDEDAARLREEAATDRLRPLRLDVTCSTDIAAAVEHIAAERGPQGLQALVNNAGIAVAGPLEFLPLDALRQQLEVNVVGLLAVTQTVLPLLRRGQGRVVNISSISGKIAYPMMGPYAASKFAVEALTDALRRELAPWGLAVVSVLPGGVRTPIWEKSLQAGEALLASLPPQAQAWYGPRIEAIKAHARRMARAGIPVEAVVQAVEHACTARRPRTRYIVGRGPKLIALLTCLLPDPWLDAFIARAMRR